MRVLRFAEKNGVWEEREREKGRVVVKTKVVGIVKPSLSLSFLFDFIIIVNIGCVKTGDLTLLIIIR